MIHKLRSAMKSLNDFSEEEIDLFLGYLEETVVPKGDHFLKLGEVSHHIAYITSGLAMFYNLNNGLEIPVDFATEGEWVGHLKSFSNRIPSDLAIKAIEETRLLRLSATGLQQLFQSQPKFMALKSYYTEISLIRNAEHGADLAMLDARQRYYKFMAEKPDLIRRVPQYHIAAYLGIKPQSLSRLRKEK